MLDKYSHESELHENLIARLRLGWPTIGQCGG